MNTLSPETLKQIKDLVAQGELHEALEGFYGSVWENEARSLQADLAKLDQKENQGVFHQGEYQVELNRISTQIGELMDRVERGEEPLEESKVGLWQKLGESWKVVASVVGGIVLLLTLVINLDKVSDIFEKWGLWGEEERGSTSLFMVDSAYHVLLLPFGAEGRCELESNLYHHKVYERLLELDRAENLNIEVKRQDTISCDAYIPDSVRAYGGKMGADLVVYGNYQERCEWDTTLFNVRYVSLDTTVDESPMGTIGSDRQVLSNRPDQLARSGLDRIADGEITGTVEDVIYWVLGMKAYYKDKYEQALGYWEEIEPEPGRKEYAVLLGYRANCNLFLGKYKETIQDFDRAIELDLNFATAYTNRGNAKLNLGEYEGAIEDYDRAIELDPKYALAYTNRGAMKYYLGENEGAIEDLDLAIELDPKYALSYANRGAVKDGLGDHEGAIEDYDRAIELYPKYALAYSNRGNAKYELGDYEGAIEDYDCAIELYPKDAIAYTNRGAAKYELGDYEGAIEWYLNFVPAYNNRGNAKYGLGDYEGALKDYDRAIELYPKDALSYTNRGATKYELGDYEGAIEDYDCAIELYPKDAIVYINRGAAKDELGDYEGAIEWDPKDALSYTNRGAMKYELGDYEGAIEDYDRAIALDPKFAYAYNNRGGGEV